MGIYPIEFSFLSKAKQITTEYQNLSGNWTIDSQLLHIVTEVAEVQRVLRNKNGEYGHGTKHYHYLLEEIADVFLATITLVDMLEITNDDLNDALRIKLHKVENRVMELEKQLKETLG